MKNIYYHGVFYKVLLICGLLIISFQKNVAQFKPFVFFTIDSSSEIQIPLKNYHKQIDSSEVENYIHSVTEELDAKLHISSRISSRQNKKDTIVISMLLTKSIVVQALILDEESVRILSSKGIKKIEDMDQNLDSNYVRSISQIILNHYNNNGFPFAKVYIDSVFLTDKTVKLKFDSQLGDYFEFDTIKVLSKMAISKSFLQRFLELRPGRSFDQSKINRIYNRLNELPYIQTSTQPKLGFKNNKIVTILELALKKSSKFDFLIGILPQINSDGRRKWLISGDLLAELYNQFGYGEYLFGQIKRQKPEFLELQLKASLPYVGGLPFGTHLDFRIFKNGIENIDIFFDGGIQYNFGGFNNIKLKGSYRSSRLLSIDTVKLLMNLSLPTKLDVTYSGAGFQIGFRKIDYQFNPSKGYSLDINAIIGIKKILPSFSILELPGFAYSYDSLRLSSVQSEFDLTAAYYFPCSDWAAIKFGLSGAWKYNAQKLLFNELYRIGGNKSLRGFDEESIFTDLYGYSTFEFRLLLDQRSYISLPFIDIGYTKIVRDNVSRYDQIIGMGIGINFGTNSGTFSLAFAAGKNIDQNLDFSRMKIHFGYVNIF